MARIRSVHPGLFTDESFASLSMASRVLFIGLWCEADDRGVFEWKPLTLKMRLFPVDVIDMPAILGELVDRDMIRRFDHDGKQYGAVRNFGRFQRPRTPKAVHPQPASLAKYLAVDGKGVQGALAYSRDVTAADRKRRQREKGDDGHASAVTHAATVTAKPSPFPQNAEVSRQMEDGGCSSVAKATAASGPPEPSAIPAKPDYRADLFRDGLAVLRQITGKNESAARTLIGRWLKTVRDDARLVLRTIEDARSEEAADPVPWIEASLRGPRRPEVGSLAFANMRH